MGARWRAMGGGDDGAMGARWRAMGGGDDGGRQRGVFSR
uniref:Uncharacterized protein n=1 Tax=Oryza rufipogon TaxID=4529 RepID=A0A0E0P618_ORYRU